MQSIPFEIFDTREAPPVEEFLGIHPATLFPLPTKRKKFRNQVRTEYQKFKQASDVFF